MDWARILAYPVDVCGCSSEVFYASLLREILATS